MPTPLEERISSYANKANAHLVQAGQSGISTREQANRLKYIRCLVKKIENRLAKLRKYRPSHFLEAIRLLAQKKELEEMLERVAHFKLFVEQQPLAEPLQTAAHAQKKHKIQDRILLAEELGLSYIRKRQMTHSDWHKRKAEIEGNILILKERIASSEGLLKRKLAGLLEMEREKLESHLATPSANPAICDGNREPVEWEHVVDLDEIYLRELRGGRKKFEMRF